MSEFFNSGSVEMDAFLEGGLSSRGVNLIYGPASTGKTTLCLMAAVEALKAGNKVLMIDSEMGFSTERFTQISEDKELMENLVLIRPKSFLDQYNMILSIKQMIEELNIALVIIDTIGRYYRLELNKNPENTNKMMAEQLRDLTRIARDTSTNVIVANQVYSKVDGSNEVIIVGGKMIRNHGKCILELFKDNNNKRKIKLRKQLNVLEEKERFFVIDNKGIQLV